TLVAVLAVSWGAAHAADAAPARSVPAGVAIPARTAPPAAPRAAPAAPVARGTTLSGKVNLNTAAATQLMLLPGVGPAKAERIVAWRQKYGAFKRVADLRKVRGFGYKSFKKLEPYLDVKGETTLGKG